MDVLSRLGQKANFGAMSLVW